MSSISSSLNYLLASNYSTIGWPTPPAANPPDFKAALGNLKPGTTVSARTDYTVNSNGRLVAQSTAVSVGDATEENTPRQAPYSYHQAEGHAASFADLIKPKPTLSPSEEAVLFDAAGTDADGRPKRFFDQQGAQDENGEAVEVEVIAPDNRPTQTLAQQKQAQVSNLYARIGEIVFSTEPALAMAA